MKNFAIIIGLIVAALLLKSPSAADSPRAYNPYPAGSCLSTAYYATNIFSDSSNWYTSMGATISSNRISVVNGGDVVFGKFISFKDTVCSNHWRVTARGWNATTKSGNTYGFSVGMRSVNAFSLNSMAVFPNTSNDGNTGRFEFFTQANGASFTSTFRMGAGSAVANAVNDKLVVSMERNNSTVRMTVYNQTTQTVAADTTVTISLTGTPIMPNAAVPTIWIHSTSGTVLIDSFYFQDFEPQNADIAFVGDSKTLGYGATNFASTYPSILGQTFPNYAVFAGFGDRTQEVRARLPQIIAAKPKVVILAIGSNDIRNSVTTGTWQANYTYIDNTLRAAGITVWHCLPFKENTGSGGVDLTSQKNWIAANFAGRTIDTWTPTNEASCTYSDGIHLNDRGNKRVATAIKTCSFLTYKEIKVVNTNQ
jgi:lysophospholipase L1-like esterase